MASTGAALRLVGIVSFGNGCATRDTYGVYTRAAAMREFLGVRPAASLRLVQRPVMTGRTRVGSLLRCAPGRWAGAGPKRYTYRWVRPIAGDQPDSEALRFADEAYQRLPGSGVGRTYRVRAGDRGARIGCLVIARTAQYTAAENAVLRPVPGPPPVDPEQEPTSGDDEDEDHLL